jgi:hypothetical protein
VSISSENAGLHVAQVNECSVDASGIKFLHVPKCIPTKSALTLTENDVLGQRVLERFFSVRLSVSLKCVSLGWLR